MLTYYPKTYYRRFKYFNLYFYSSQINNLRLSISDFIIKLNLITINTIKYCFKCMKFNTLGVKFY